MRVQPSSATLVSLAALGDSDTCILLQLPHRDAPMPEHEGDMLRSATNLHIGTAAHPKLVQVDALQSLRDAKTQCAVSPGAFPTLRHVRTARASIQGLGRCLYGYILYLDRNPMLWLEPQA